MSCLTLVVAGKLQAKPQDTEAFKAAARDVADACDDVWGLNGFLNPIQAVYKMAGVNK